MDVQLWMLVFIFSLIIPHVKCVHNLLKQHHEMFKQVEAFNKLDPKELRSLLKRADVHAMLEEDPQVFQHAISNYNSSSSITEQCARDLGQWMWDLNKEEPYAMRMRDAYGKPPSGLFTLNLKWYGAFDQCVTTNVAGSFEPKYCLCFIGDISLNLGTCVPDSCSARDVSTIIRSVADVNIFTHCSEEHKYNGADTAAIVICALFLLAALCGSIYDTFWGGKDNKGKKGKLHQLLISFSVPRNAGKILDMNVRSKPLASLNGMRVFSILWVIVGHTTGIFKHSTNPMEPFEHYFNDLSFQGLSNATVSVDSFFYMSGFLVTYLTMRELYAKKGRLNWALFYFHRYWRLTPLYMICIMLFTTLLCLAVKGPYDYEWAEDYQIIKDCKKNWWGNALYINNFYPNTIYPGYDLENLDQPCYGVSWYLANDMQFYVISPLVLYAWYRNRMAGFAVWTSLLLMCLITTGVVAKDYGINPFMHIPSDDPIVQWHVYGRPYYRIGPYLVGMMLGFIMTDPKFKNIKLNKPVALLGWGLALVNNLWILYGLFFYIDQAQSHTMSDDVAALYVATHRTAWAMGLAWVTFACAKGYGGYVNSFLSWRGFVPLARLTYAVFLIHMTIMMMSWSRQKFPIFSSHITLAYYMSAYVILSFVAAFILSVLIEAPFMGMEKVILPQQKKKEENKKSALNGINTPDAEKGAFRNQAFDPQVKE